MDKSLLYRPLFESPEFARFRDALAGWVATGADDDLADAAGELSRLVRSGAIPPEHLLASIHPAVLPGAGPPCESPLSLRVHRYVHAVSRLMQACFGREARLRVVLGSDGRIWSVMPIAEGARWDPEIEMRRRGWLCCVTSGDRRYISPVPGDWELLTDTEIAGAIGGANPDQRGR